eukprot:754979-Hanusia_phi.AAC.2
MQFRRGKIFSPRLYDLLSSPLTVLDPPAFAQQMAVEPLRRRFSVGPPVTVTGAHCHAVPPSALAAAAARRAAVAPRAPALRRRPHPG